MIFCLFLTCLFSHQVYIILVVTFDVTNSWLYLFFIHTGIRIFIDSKAQLTLLGTEMDYTEDKLKSEFIFNNPNVKGICGCGESFSV